MGLDATFWVTALQLLVSLYQLRRDSGREKIQLLINLQQEIRANPPENPKAFIQERLEAALPQEEAAEVQTDLSTIELLKNAPIEASAFDYWSVLEQLMGSIREFCHRHQIFSAEAWEMPLGVVSSSCPRQQQRCSMRRAELFG